MNSTPVLCKTCKKPKANYACGLCEEHVCKNCAEFLVEDAFSFLPNTPAQLKHSTYCSQCFDDVVSAPLREYEETMEKAKEVLVFAKEQSKLTAHLVRKEEPLSVEKIEDKDEALMRVSFHAVQLGFNALLDVQFKTSKIIVGSHKKVIWAVTGVPSNVNPREVRDYD